MVVLEHDVIAIDVKINKTYLKRTELLT